ncbi:MAG: hypothetical protein JRI23_21490 [Deltaproteobacteria bacterium]|jgi:type VI protein secretion system component VasK|nr:hypothetical protein [Deltaproteobacteria bacterium]MBW2534516.1 hypothetical protein [Deltaproteobacteria bacterium]
MKRRGRPVLGAFSGFFAGLFIGLSLLFYGVIPLESNLLVILPVAGLVLVWAMAMWLPIPRGRAAAPPAEPVAEPEAGGEQ